LAAFDALPELSMKMGFHDPFALFSLIGCIVAAGIWLETRPRLAQFSVLLVIFVPTVLSALKIIPRDSELYSFVARYFVPLAIPLLLLSANLRQVFRGSGQLLAAFSLAVVSTLLAALVGIFALGLSPEAKEWAAIATAGFIGGSANTAAVADTFGRADAPEMAILIASVYAIALPFMALLYSLPSMTFVWRFFASEEDCASASPPAEPTTRHNDVTAFSLGLSLAAAGVIVAMSDAIVGLSGIGELRYVLITLMSLLAASCLPRAEERFSGHFHVGQILIYVFFATLGAQIDFTLIRGFGIEIVGFSAFVLAVHLSVLLTAGRLLKIDGGSLLIASNACILGPATAGAMAAARGWRHLIAPGILCGVLGYAIANFFGIALTAAVMQKGGG
jgi:uncharacterized membrane protein